MMQPLTSGAATKTEAAAGHDHGEDHGQHHFYVQESRATATATTIAGTTGSAAAEQR